MVAAGLALAYVKYSSAYVATENEAHAAKRGDVRRAVGCSRTAEGRTSSCPAEVNAAAQYARFGLGE
jgi:hypothetical protein